jgi:hypothetical protein
MFHCQISINSTIRRCGSHLPGVYALRNSKWPKKASRLAFRCLRWCFLLGWCTLLYARLIEQNWIAINFLQLTLPHLPWEFNGYGIVQISDIHRDRWMTAQRIRRIVRLVNQQ